MKDYKEYELDNDKSWLELLKKIGRYIEAFDQRTADIDIRDHKDAILFLCKIARDWWIENASIVHHNRTIHEMLKEEEHKFRGLPTDVGGVFRNLDYTRS